MGCDDISLSSLFSPHRRCVELTAPNVLASLVTYHQDVRLTALEKEKARLERLALRRHETIVKQERQVMEVAARREWLKVSLRSITACILPHA